MAKTQVRFSNDHQAELAKILKAVGYRHGAWQVFRDFVAMGAIALSNATDYRYRVAREAEYMSIVSRYSKEDAQELARGFASVVMGLEAGMCDFLGSLYMSLDLGNAWTGQYFTPYEIARLMASLTLIDRAQEAIQFTGFVSVSDPCIGGGAMVVAAAHALMDSGINYQQHMHVTGTDIDITAVHMAYIQLSLLHVPAVIQHGNSISLEVWSTWRTPAHTLGFWDSKLRRAGNSAALARAILAPVELEPDELVNAFRTEADDAGIDSLSETIMPVYATRSPINLRDQIALF